jgi:hypothetical protein
MFQDILANDYVKGPQLTGEPSVEYITLMPFDLEPEIAKPLLSNPIARGINLDPHHLSPLFSESDKRSTVPTTHIQNAFAAQGRPLTELPHNLPAPLDVTCGVVPPGLHIATDAVFVRREVCGKGGWKVVPVDLTPLDGLFYSPAFVRQNDLKKGTVLLTGKIILTSGLEDVSIEEAGLHVLWKARYQGVSQVT